MRPVPLLVAAGLAALVVLAALLAARQPPPVAVTAAPVLTPSPTVTATASLAPTATATASPSPTAAGTHEDGVLGYRITLPSAYRRSYVNLVTAPSAMLGVSTYTVQTEQQAREACMRDAGHIPTVREPPDISVTVYRDPGGFTADAWAKTPRVAGAQPLSHHHSVEGITVGGYEAVKLVQDNASMATSAVVIRARDRVYEVAYSGAWSPWTASLRTFLDDIAKTFVAVTPSSFPSPTPTVAPRAAANETAQALARAFAARDADAVARLLPDCHFAVLYAIDGATPGQGPLNRSVPLFSQALRQRFAAGDLTVTVDPTLQPGSETGLDSYLIRSEWRRPEGTRRVDMEIRVRDGRAIWAIARHHFTRGECVSYGGPWTDDPARC